MKSTLLFAAILLMVLASGCEKNCTQLNICQPSLSGVHDPRIIGYYANDVDSQILIHYKPNGLFDQPVDSGAFINTWVTGGYIYNESDTQELVIGFTGGSSTTQQVNDMKLVLPNVRTYRFTDVMVEGKYFEEDEFKCSVGSRPCYRRIVSMKIDGVLHDFSDPNASLTLYK